MAVAVTAIDVPTEQARAGGGDKLYRIVPTIFRILVFRGNISQYADRRQAPVYSKQSTVIISSNQRRSSKMARISLNQIAPGFSLADYRGRLVSLADFRGQKNVLLVFNRTFA